ncbi:MAG: response regulator, partial [Gemmatimonadaceae bacterium]
MNWAIVECPQNSRSPNSARTLNCFDCTSPPAPTFRREAVLLPVVQLLTTPVPLLHALHPHAGRPSSNGSVLLVDDEGRRRDELASMLRAEGFDVTTSTCGGPAVLAVGTLWPDAVVLDLHRPDLLNAGLCPQLKAAARGLVPVLHVSLDANAHTNRARILDDGADGCLLAPFDADELRATICSLVRLGRHDKVRAAECAVNAVLHGALDELSDHIALLDADGTVLAVNRAWTNFALANGYAHGDAGLGVSYHSVCDHVTGADSEDARFTSEQLKRL